MATFLSDSSTTWGFLDFDRPTLVQAESFLKRECGRSEANTKWFLGRLTFGMGFYAIRPVSEGMQFPVRSRVLKWRIFGGTR
jgi:hypothetical protein